ncbi:hypothetical protein ABPG74_002604 [Tetrahymena malaccensis]
MKIILLAFFFILNFLELIRAKNLLIAREWLNPPFTGWGSGKSIKCAGQLIEANKEVLYIGGDQKSVQKQFSNLPEHFRVLIRIDFVAIDAWGYYQKIAFSADSKVLGSYSSYNQGSSDRLHLKICGKQSIQDRFERDGMFLFKGFFEDDFSNLSFDEYGFNFNPILPEESNVNLKDWAQFSDCIDNTVLKRFYGGFGIIGKDVAIKKTWDIMTNGFNQNILLLLFQPQQPLLLQGQCNLDCGLGFYPNKPICSPCNTECYSCYGPKNNQCLKCTGNRYYFKQTNSCLLECPETYFPNTSSNNCDPCNSKCLTCNGPSENQCLTCTSVAPSRFLTDHKCEAQCPPGQYGETSNQTCQPCKSPCLTCKNTANKCTSCIEKRFLYGEDCLEICPERTYSNNFTQMCEACHGLCGNCNGANFNNCLTCDDEDGYYDSTTNQCVSQCPSKYFPTRENKLQICKLCDATCGECKPPGDRFSCTICTGGRYLNYNNSCDKDCPDYYYKDKSNYVCKNCHPSCLTCHDSSSTSCITCPKGRYFSQNTCLSRCPEGTYPDDVNSQCILCHPTCASCEGDLYNQCTRCKLGKYLQDKKCSEKCKDGYFPNKLTDSQLDLASNSCQKCDKSCKTCIGVNNNQCTKCKEGTYLLNNSCVYSCPDGYVISLDKAQCLICHSTCSTCHPGNLDYCLTCLEGWYKHANRCLKECPDGTFPSSKSEEKINGLIHEILICKNCIKNCKTCTGPSDVQCLEYYPVSEQDLLGMLIFYIFLGKSIYCFVTFAIGIYLDYNDYKRRRDLELQEAQKLQIDDQRKPRITINDIELNKTTKTDQQKSLFNFDIPNKDYSPTGSPNITRQNLNTENQSPAQKLTKNTPVRKQRKFQTAINQSSQNESIENEKLRYTKFRKGTYGQNQSIVNISTQKLVDDELKSQLAKKHGKIVGCYDPVSKSFVQIPDQFVKKNPELPQRSFISFFFTFFEITSLLFYRDYNLLHILRVLTYYCKLLFMFYLSSRLLYISPLSIIGFVIAIQIIMVTVEKMIYNLSQYVEKLLSVIFTSFILLIVYHINWFFSPQLAKISYQQDFDWSIYYLTIFGTDLVSIQIVFMSIQYWFTKKHIFSDQLKLRKSQRILCFFLFKDKFARWMKEVKSDEINPEKIKENENENIQKSK